ncbi:MAG: FGGY-family carbohydrate kinase, partial [Planctomycetota bacterium]
AVQSRPPGNQGALLLPWFDPEIVPKVLIPGVHRHHLAADDVAGNCRAVCECQMLAMRRHLERAGQRPTELRATGGASRNPLLLRIMADIFQAPVSVVQTANSAGLGAALRAAQAIVKRPWSAVVAGFTDPEPGTTVDPDPATRAVYEDLLSDYADFEEAVLQTLC